MEGELICYRCGQFNSENAHATDVDNLIDGE